MKELYLIKHGHADTFGYGGRDKDAPLSPLGYRIVNLLAGELQKAEVMPDIILTSPAQRAFMTTNLLAKKLGISKRKVHQEEDLYLNTYRQCLNLIERVEDKCNKLMIVSHEPAITDLFNNFLNPPLINVPAASAALIKLHTDRWADCNACETDYNGLILSGISVKQSAYHELSENAYIYDL